MKRILTSLLLVLTGFFMFSMFQVNTVKAEEDIIDLYPNEDVKNLKGTYGNSNWVLDFAGYRYHTVSFMARFASNFVGIDNAEKTEFKGADLGSLTANAMGGFIHNNTEKDIILKDGDRTALTGVVNRAWAVFDENGKLVLYENHIGTFYLKEVAGKDYYQLASPEEIAQYKAAEEDDDLEFPAGVILSHIRIALDEDGETYKAEPLGYLKWTNADYVPANAEQGIEEEGSKSVVVDYDPNEVPLKAGWTALHFSTWDRGKPKFNDLIAEMPYLLASQEETMELKYFNPAPYFVNLAAKDANPGEAGINIVFDYESVPSVSRLISDIEARHVDGEQFIAKEFSNVDFEVKIFDEDDALLETVKVTYDEVNKKYTADKETFEKVDTSNWGARYKVTYEATQPESDDETSYVSGPKVIENATIDVGVLPIHFTGVAGRTVKEGLPIDLLEGIAAFDNSRDKNNISSSLTYEIVNTKTNSTYFNSLTPKAGVYEVTVKAKYDYVQAIDTTEDVTFYLGDDAITIAKERINITVDPFTYSNPRPPFAMFTEFDENTRNLLLTSDTKYNVVMVLVNGVGEVVAYFHGETLKMALEGGSEVAVTGSNREPSRAQWINAINFKTGYKLIAGYLVNDVNTLLRTAKIGAKFEGLGFGAEVAAEQTYRLTIQDVTPPRVTVKAEEFTIYTDNSFKNAQEAVLSNIEVFEEYDFTVAVPGINRVDITEPGEYNITVVVTDSDNEVEVEFKLIVKEAKASQEDVDDLLDEIADLEDEIEALQADLVGALDDVEALEDELAAAKTRLTKLENDLKAALDAIEALENVEVEAPAKTGCKSAITGGFSILVLSFMLGVGLMVFLKKRK